jgi:ribosomal protein L19
MKIVPILKKVENIYIRQSKKILTYKKMLKGDLISLVYSDIDKEHVKLLNFVGFCRKFRSKGINTKLSARILVRRVYAELEFFLYSRFLADAGVVRRVKKNFQRSSNKYKFIKKVKVLNQKVI